MNYMNISHCNMVNGEGLRTVLWVSGCSHNCKNCQNSYSHDPCVGLPFDNCAKEEFFKDLHEDWCDGVTFSGGDPLYRDNIECVTELAKEIKEKFSDKTIWLYTGYTWSQILEDAKMREVLKYIDIVVDGPFIEELKDVNIHWRGSSNQNIIDVKKRISQIASLASC